MRICLLSYRGNMFCGGQGIYVYNLSKALASLGHEVHLVAGPPLPRKPDGVYLHPVENLNMFGKRAVELAGHPISRLFSPINFMEFAATRLGVLPEMFTFGVRAFQILKGLLSEQRFDIVHDNQSLGYGLLLMRELGIPLVATIHHPLPIDREEHLRQASRFREKLKRVIYYPAVMQHIVARKVDRVIAVSNSSAERVINVFGVGRQKVRVVYNGVDTVKFSPGRDGKKDGARRLIFVGNTDDRKKGFVYLMEAMRLMGDNVRLTVVNGADRRPRIIRELASGLGMERRIDFLSGIDDERLVEEYRRSSVAVVPSTYEGFGFPAAEAMSCGVPVVAARAGALPEVVGNGGAAILVSSKEPLAIAEAVRALFGDEALRRELGLRGRRRIEENFSWSRAAAETIDVYREAISAYHRL